MNCDKVAALHQLFKIDKLDADLLGPCLGYIRVIANQRCAKACKTLRDKGSDAAQSNNSDGLFIELDTREFTSEPLTVFHRGMGIRDVPGKGHDVANGEFCRGDDVRGRCVYHHDTCRGCGLNVHVVQSDSGSRDHLKFWGL